MQANGKSTPAVITAVQDGVGIVTLNRPEKRNAINGELLTLLREILDRHDRDPDVRVIILTGAGPAFCAGMDLYAFDDLSDVPVVQWDQGRQRSAPWVPLSTPIVCAVNGPVATGGLEVALACDIIVASDAAAFADTHARAGFVPGWGLSVRLPLAVGLPKAREMSLTARFLSAQEAYEAGLAQRLVPAAELMQTAMDIAHSIAANDARTVSTYLALYRSVEGEFAAAAYHREATHMREHPEERRPTDDVTSRASAIINRGRGAGAV
jgi:enoyl-CoA hydratase